MAAESKRRRRKTQQRKGVRCWVNNLNESRRKGCGEDARRTRERQGQEDSRKIDGGGGE